MVLFLAVSLGAVCEVVARFFLGDNIPLFPRFVTSAVHGDFIIRSNTPGMVYRHKSSDGEWQVRINRQGFRADQEFSFEKPAGMKRILLLGDSFTMASEVNIEDSFGAVLQRKLKEKGIETEVINMGVSGFSPAEQLVVLENKGLAFKPDAVIVGFFINDYGDSIRTDLYRLRNGELSVHKKEYAPVGRIQDWLRHIPFYAWISQHSYFYNYVNRILSLRVKGRLEDQNREQIQKGLGTQDRNAYEIDLAYALVKKMIDVTHRQGAAFILMDIPTYWNERSVKFMDRFKEGEIDLFVDALSLFKKSKSNRLIYRPHGDRHWTELGHQIVGEYLAEKLEPKLAQKKPEFEDPPSPESSSN